MLHVYLNNVSKASAFPDKVSLMLKANAYLNDEFLSTTLLDYCLPNLLDDNAMNSPQETRYRGNSKIDFAWEHKVLHQQ